MKYRCVNYYSAEWDDIYPVPGYDLNDEFEWTNDDESEIVNFGDSDF